MARTHEAITDHLASWVAEQAMFFVATSPLSSDGHVNVSPKGPIDSLRVLGEDRIAYLDIAGSGSETIAHLRENGRIVVMLCAFKGPPRIVRFHGRGKVLLPSDPGFEELRTRASFADASVPEARRAIILVRVTRVSDSCGYGVPLMSFDSLRDHHAVTTSKKLRTLGQDGYAAHRAQSNVTSIDGLPAVAGP